MWTLNAEAVNINIHEFHKANGKKNKWTGCGGKGKRNKLSAEANQNI